MSGEKETPPVVDVESNTTEKYVDPKLQKHAHDADEAMKAISELHGETITIDEETNKRLLRRIDWHIMPIMYFVYGMNYLDSMVYYKYSTILVLTDEETTLSYASVMGLKTDLNLVGDDYQWLGSLFYFGMLFLLIPKRYPLTMKVISLGNIPPTDSSNVYPWENTPQLVSLSGG